jgi:hypothetical protein
VLAVPDKDHASIFYPHTFESAADPELPSLEYAPEPNEHGQVLAASPSIFNRHSASGALAGVKDGDWLLIFMN